ncbi:MAG: aminotransferase class V-fold PLP-dependent enzyme [Pedobacter sp.]|nr:MAG: aminotransferase class V-fold PLP-dependent enzyme [Pedobacter sp.]
MDRKFVTFRCKLKTKISSKISLIDLKKMGAHFISGAGHKFHGPKGTGILYASESIRFGSLIHGGSQERKKRAGTENVHGIIGFTKALGLATEHYPTDRIYISGLNKKMRAGLMLINEKITFNSNEDSLYTVLSVNFPENSNTDLILALLDRKGICASGGSACTSAEESGSHVISALNLPFSCATLRFSFSKKNTDEDILVTLRVVRDLLVKQNPIMQAI